MINERRCVTNELHVYKLAIRSCPFEKLHVVFIGRLICQTLELRVCSYKYQLTLGCVIVSYINIVISIFDVKGQKLVLRIAVGATEVLILVLIIEIWTSLLFHSG